MTGQFVLRRIREAGCEPGPVRQQGSHVANRLLKGGMIERVPRPGRAIRHRLTPRGEATLRKGYEVVGPVLESSFAPLTSRQREDFYRLIGRALVEGNPPQRVGL